MKKWSLIPAVFAMIFFSSADSPKYSSVQVGNKAPQLYVSNAYKAESLKDKAGKFVVLNFWDTTDPQSRIANIELDRLTSSLSASGIDVISVCVSADKTLYQQLKQIDSLADAHQYHYTDSQLPSIIDDYSLESTPCIYLISPDGEIIVRGYDVEDVLNICPAFS